MDCAQRYSRDKPELHLNDHSAHGYKQQLSEQNQGHIEALDSDNKTGPLSHTEITDHQKCLQ